MSQWAGGKVQQNIIHVTLCFLPSTYSDIFSHASAPSSDVKYKPTAQTQLVKTTAVIPFPGQKFGQFHVCVCAQLSWVPTPSFRLCPRPQIDQHRKCPLESMVLPHTLPCPHHLGSNITQLLYVLSSSFYLHRKAPAQKVSPLFTGSPETSVAPDTGYHLFNCQWLTEGKNGFTDGSRPASSSHVFAHHKTSMTTHFK